MNNKDTMGVSEDDYSVPTCKSKTQPKFFDEHFKL